MKILNSEMTSLLDKLYNLRGADSTILVSMDKEKEVAEETREKTSALKSELQTKINNLEAEETVLADEGEKLKAALETIRKADFANVIEHLNIDFDPDAICEKVATSLPATLEKVASEKREAAESLVKVEDEMNEAITKIEELGIRRDEAVSNQERLNRYFDLALSSNINITRDEITSLLAKFDFTEEEQREAAKILMFPEDGLFDYENSRNDKPVSDKSITEVMREAKEVSPAEEKHESASFEIPVIGNNNEENRSKDEVLDYLNSIGFNTMDFTNSDIEKLMNNYDESMIAKNVELVKSLNINLDIFVENIDLLVDPELKAKLDIIMSLGKDSQDIYLNPNVLTKYNLNELQKAISTLKESGLDPRTVPLMAF